MLVRSGIQILSPSISLKPVSDQKTVHTCKNKLITWVRELHPGPAVPDYSQAETCREKSLYCSISGCFVQAWLFVAL